MFPATTKYSVETAVEYQGPYPSETGTYLAVSARNIPQIVKQEPLIFSYLVGIE